MNRILGMMAVLLAAAMPVCTLAQAGEFPLADRIPSGAMAYLGWAGQNKVFDQSQWGQMLRDPASAAVASQITSILRSLPMPIRRPAKDGLDMADVLWRHPMAVALLDVTPGSGSGRDSKPAQVSAILLADIGQDRELFDKALSDLLTLLPEDSLKKDGDFTVLPGPTKIVFGYIDATFVLAVGYHTLDKIRVLKPVKSLAADALFVQRMAAVGSKMAKGKDIGSQAQLALYVDAERVGKAVWAMSTGPKGESDEVLESVTEGMKAAGVDQVTCMVSSMRVVDGGMYSRTRVFTPAPHHGVLGLFVSHQVSEAELGALPADADMAGVFSFSVGELTQLMGQTVEDGGKAFQNSLAKAKKETGVALKEDVLDSIGDTWTYYAMIAHDDVPPVFAASVNLRNADKLSTALDKLMDYASKQDTKPLRFGVQKVGDLLIYTMDGPFQVPTLPGAQPAFCVYKDRLVLSWNPKALQMAVAAPSDTLAKDKAFLAALSHVNSKASSLAYTNTARTLPTFGMMFGGLGQALPPDVRDTVLANLAALAKYARPDVESIWGDADGVVMESFGSHPVIRVPGGVLGVASTVAVLMPTLAKARELAKRAGSMVNLSNIGKGMALWAVEHEDKLPPSLEEEMTQEGFSAKFLVSPISGKKSYYYLPFKKSPAEPTAVIVVYEDPANYKGKGTNVLMSDFSVKRMSTEEFQKELKRATDLLEKEGAKVVAPR